MDNIALVYVTKVDPQHLLTRGCFGIFVSFVDIS